jgi:hypothetical protein
LPRSMPCPQATRGRVACGMITSSILPRSATLHRSPAPTSRPPDRPFPV